MAGNYTLQLSTLYLSCALDDVEYDNRMFDSSYTQEYDLPYHSYSEFISALGGLLVGSAINVYIKPNTSAVTKRYTDSTVSPGQLAISSASIPLSSGQDFYKKFYTPMYGLAMLSGILNMTDPLLIRRFTYQTVETYGGMPNVHVGNDWLCVYTRVSGGCSYVYLNINSTNQSSFFNCGLLATSKVAGTTYGQQYPAPSSTTSTSSVLPKSWLHPSSTSSATSLSLSNLKFNLLNDSYVTFTRSVTAMFNSSSVTSQRFFPLWNYSLKYTLAISTEYRSPSNALYHPITMKNQYQSCTCGGSLTGETSSDFDFSEIPILRDNHKVNMAPSSTSTSRLYFFICPDTSELVKIGLDATMELPSFKSRLRVYVDSSVNYCYIHVYDGSGNSTTTSWPGDGAEHTTSWRTYLSNPGINVYSNGSYPCYTGYFTVPSVSDSVTGKTTKFGYIKARIEFDTDKDSVTNYYTQECQIKLFGVFKNGVLQS